ncbi:hypothetical protein ACTQWG_04755 [Blautia sp. HCP3S3_H10_1]|uniref:hypothetical protein n=1 Tax=unclassified Blautia TaxID=2648079 RepID=UPI003F93F591
MDYAYDISGWLDDCLDEMDMREEYENLLKMCEDLLNLFGWPEYTGSDLKLRKIFALLHLGRKEEAGHFFERMILFLLPLLSFMKRLEIKRRRSRLIKLWMNMKNTWSGILREWKMTSSILLMRTSI